MVVRRVPLASMLRGLLPHLPRRVKEEDQDRGLGVARLVVSGDLLLGLVVSVDCSTAVCTRASVVEMDDVERVEAWLDRAALDVVAAVVEAGSSDAVELVVDEGLLLEAREVGALWGGRVVRVPLLDEPMSPDRVCAARMLVQASSACVEAQGRMWVWPRHVALVGRTADALGEPLRACLGRYGEHGGAVVVWGWGRADTDAERACSYLACTSGSSLASALVPVLDEACYEGPLMGPLMGAVLQDLGRPAPESAETRFADAVESFLVSAPPLDGPAPADPPTTGPEDPADVEGGDLA